jgi:hypothetical protein
MIYYYNGIEMKMVKTNIIQFNAEFTDDQTTYLYTHYMIDIEAVINPMTMAYLGGAGAGEPTFTPGTFPASTIKAIRHTLLQPRKPLLIKDETGNILLSTPEQDVTTDAKNGPLPNGCHMVNVSGARTVLLRWVCEGWIRECPYIQDTTTITPYMISNRWSDQMVINEYQLATRIIVGHTIFDRAYLDLAQLSPDYFRNIGIFPRVNPNFQRKNIDIVQNSNGIELDWRVTDQELMWFLGETKPDIAGNNPSNSDMRGFGSGILEIDGVQNVRSNDPSDTDTGILATGQTLNSISLMATGSFYANQWVMLQRLMQIVTGLTPPLMTNPQGNLQKAYWFTSASVSRSLGQKSKWVRLDVTIRCPALDVANEITGNVNLIPVTQDIWHAMNPIVKNQTEGLSPDLIKDKHSRGSSGLHLVTQVLTEPCLEQEEPPEVTVSDERDDSSIQENPEPRSPQYRRDIVPEIPSKYDPNPVGNYPYTTYKYDMDVDTNEGYKQIPITGPPPGSDDPSDPNYQSGGSTKGTSGIVRVHLPITRYTIRFVAERLGKPPIMPSPKPTNTEEFILLSWYLSPFSVVPAPDGITPVFRIDGEFRYAKVTANDSLNPEIFMGKLPFSQFGPDKITQEYFSKEMKGF